MVSMFEKLKHAHGDAPRKPNAPKAGKSADNKDDKNDDDEVLGWLSSHPQVDERIRAIQAFVAANPCADCRALPIDWPAAQADLKAVLRGARDKP